MADDWFKAIEELEPHIVKISTPSGSGTGWLVSMGRNGNLCALATAAHVIDHAHYWEQPIRIHHHKSEQPVILRPPDRAILIYPDNDVAAIVFNPGDIPFPCKAFPLIEKDKHLKRGVQIGWLGFPAIPMAEMSFFSGHISSYVESEQLYFVDGVAINGVSGGPAFVFVGNSPTLTGVVSAYIANRATGETLPGVAVVRDVTRFHHITERFRSIDEAKTQESPAPQEPPPPNA